MVKFLYFSSAVKLGPSSLPDNMQSAIRSCESTEAQSISSSPLRNQTKSGLQLAETCGYMEYITEPHLSRLHVNSSPKWNAVPLNWLQTQKMLHLQSWFCSTSTPGSTETKQSKIHLVECRSPNIQAQAPLSQRPAFLRQGSGQNCWPKLSLNRAPGHGRSCGWAPAEAHQGHSCLLVGLVRSSFPTKLSRKTSKLSRDLVCESQNSMDREITAKHTKLNHWLILISWCSVIAL